MGTTSKIKYAEALDSAISANSFLAIVSDLRIEDLKEYAEIRGYEYVYVPISNRSSGYEAVLNVALKIAIKFLDKLVSDIQPTLYSAMQITENLVDCYWHRVMSSLNDIGKLSIIQIDTWNNLIVQNELLSFFDSNKKNDIYKNLRFVVLVDSDKYNTIEDNGVFNVQRIKKGERNMRNVYISYNWEQPSNHVVVNNLQTAFKKKSIKYSLDKNDCNYRANIVEFEKSIGNGDMIVMVISASYIKSLNCMFEMANVFMKGNVEERLYPIFMDDFDRNDDDFYDEIVDYWEKEYANVEIKYQQMDAPQNKPFESEMEAIKLILSQIGDFWDYLRKINTLSLTELGNNDFAMLTNALCCDCNVEKIDEIIDPITTGVTTPNIVIQSPNAQINFNNGSGNIIVNNDSKNGRP